MVLPPPSEPELARFPKSSSRSTTASSISIYGVRELLYTLYQSSRRTIHRLNNRTINIVELFSSPSRKELIKDSGSRKCIIEIRNHC